MSWRIEETDRRITIHIGCTAKPWQASVGGGMLDVCSRAKSAGKKLVVDFHSVQFMSSGMIGEIVLLNKAAQNQEVPLRIANVNSNVLEVFKITRLNKVFQFDDGKDNDRPETLGAFVPRPRKPDSDNGHAEPPKT